MRHPRTALAAILGRRAVRFALTGLLCAVTQLVLLSTFTHRGMAALPANVAAFVLAAHLNFLLSSTFTWRDRRGGSMATRWAAFLAAISGTALLNLTVFEAGRVLLPVTAAAAAGIVVAATLNFLLGDRAIFRPPSEAVTPAAPRTLGASSPTLAHRENVR